jgi:hypothetical protein
MSVGADSFARELQDVKEATATVERITGVRPHRATIHRWFTRGLKGIRLKSVYAVGARRTKQEWIEEFFEAVGQAMPSEPAQCERPAKSKRVKAAEERLAKAGM